jgi:RimJ/RimL family protein N-acetyltransferase
MVELVKISEDDFGLLYSILKERKPEESITHTIIPSYEEHVDFIKSKPYSSWYIILQDNDKIGTVYLSQEDEVGIFIKKEYQKKGIGKKALKLLIKKNPRKKFYANVNPENSKSIQFFEDFGFKLIQKTYELSSN